MLSVRNVMYPLLVGLMRQRQQQDGGGQKDSEPSDADVLASGLIERDLTHPTDAGQRLYADVVINYIQSLEYLLLMEETAGSRRPSGGQHHGQQLDGEGHQKPSAAPRKASEGSIFHTTQEVAVEDQSPSAEAPFDLPPPLVPGNDEFAGNRCYLNRDVQVVASFSSLLCSFLTVSLMLAAPCRAPRWIRVCG